MNPGYVWSLKPHGKGWHWSAVTRDRREIVDEGQAPTKAEAAAFLVRAMTRGLVQDPTTRVQ